MRKNREPLLSPEDIARIKLKYPAAPWVRPKVVRRRKAPKPVAVKPVKPTVIRIIGVRRSKDYTNLKAAVADPRLPIIKYSLESGSQLWLKSGGHITKGQWVMLAWSTNYYDKPSIQWGGSYYTVLSYINNRWPNEAAQLTDLWVELLKLVPKEFYKHPIPTEEELIAQWKEFELRVKGNQ